MDDNKLSKDIQVIQDQINTTKLPPELKVKVQDMVERLSRAAKYGSYSAEFEMVSHYVDWITHLPWYKTTEDTLELGHVRQVLDQHHFGLDSLKERFLEYISMMILNKNKVQSSFRAPILLLVGLVGTGKTTISASIAEALGRQFIRIPFGGMSSSLDLRGQARVFGDAEPGQIIKNIRRAGVNNPVILLDEVDRVSENARGEIMGVLVELLDPAQNNSFVDHYIDYPFDLSQCLFIATANNTTHISIAVMDRLEPILMPSYSDEEKIHIARDYILPKQIAKAGLPEGCLSFDDTVWPKMARPLGFDAGIRTLERTIEGIVRKVAKLLVEGKAKEVHITNDNIKTYLPHLLMKIAVLSDIHDHIWHLTKTLDLVKQYNSEAVIFCGDMVAPFTAAYFSSLSCPIYACIGNNDAEQLRIFQKLGPERTKYFTVSDEYGEIILDNQKIAFCHHPKLGKLLAGTGDYQAVFHGHTHIAYQEKVGETLLANPGAVCGIVAGKPGKQVLEFTILS